MVFSAENLLSFSVLLVVIFNAFAQESNEVRQLPEDCPPCRRELCPNSKDLAFCEAKTVLDRCRCCEECGRTEGELCDIPGATRSDIHFGECGENLNCTIRDDIEEGNPKEAICRCDRGNHYVCGTDEVTYKSLCQLNAARIRNEKEIRVAHKGPCQSAPEIVTPPDHVKTKPGTNVVLSCELTGYPIPATVEWVWKRVDNKTISMPGDDTRISVNSRGGPEKYQVTGFLQIMEVEKSHEGDYICKARNKHGKAKASARVKILDADVKIDLEDESN